MDGDPVETVREKDEECWTGRGVALRVGFYVFGPHLFAGFVHLLFHLGQHARK
ncbi:DUF6126 family protein [Streptomyces sp. NPDC086023]|uniref:DUF6126 family protein n=1 Tax=Streptomyces sp. NPDC086023 TaxID=3365746 RepID=UPI0037CD4908